MPTVTSYRNGTTAGMAGGNPAPVKRSTVKGWSSGAVRRHTKWLYSIDAPRLSGDGYALTLTMKETPASAADFHAMRRAFLMRLDRMGAVRHHWIIEWQKRGTPHLHLAVYFDQVNPETEQNPELPSRPESMIIHWLAVAAPYGAQLRAQHYNSISGALGWLQYLSKHAARGVKHYQRQGSPAGWEKTGRLWGYGGSWPVDEPMKFDMSREAYWRYRRLVRAWTIADARKSGIASRMVFSRRMLSCPQPKLSAVRGVSGWVPEDLTLQFVALLESEGFEIVQKVD